MSHAPQQGWELGAAEPPKEPPRCPGCEDQGRPFWTLPRVPSTSNVLHASAAEARAVRPGRLELAWCGTCGLIWNAAFDAALTDTREGYEETQAHSPTFRAWLEGFVAGLHDRYGRHDELAGALVVDVGCGRGDFLAALCSRAQSRGLGIDPSSTAGRVALESGAGLAFEQRELEEASAFGEAALVTCRHTLEHVADPVSFLSELARRSAPGCPVVLEVPDAERILREGAFWDLYHEHAQYFTARSLESVAQRAGLEVMGIERVYGDQNLVLHARVAGPGAAREAVPCPAEDASLGPQVEAFLDCARTELQAAQGQIVETHRSGQRALLWGAGSKATGFLVTSGLGEEVSAVVDINPDKQGSFVAGTGHPVIDPDAAAALDPGLVVVMNPLYLEEIRADLASRGSRPRLVALGG
ncbi:MAG: class I SAM-dependent methyltransferase [Planctomycetota bacterium]|nr:class I SAM-dependent methyltransferase [Planctomycetota bacterium]